MGLDIERLDPDRFAVTYRGRRYDVDARRTGASALSLIIEGSSHLVEVEQAGDAVRVHLDGVTHALTLLDERALRSRGEKGGGAAGKQVIRTPMPGKVVKLLVSLGDEVAEGQGLVVVEAMKMENELKSPKAGRVAEVQVQEGATVEGNAPLVSVE